MSRQAICAPCKDATAPGRYQSSQTPPPYRQGPTASAATEPPPTPPTCRHACRWYDRPRGRHRCRTPRCPEAQGYGQLSQTATNAPNPHSPRTAARQNTPPEQLVKTFTSRHDTRTPDECRPNPHLTPNECPLNVQRLHSHCAATPPPPHPFHRTMWGATPNWPNGVGENCSLRSRGDSSIERKPMSPTSLAGGVSLSCRRWNVGQCAWVRPSVSVSLPPSPRSLCRQLRLAASRLACTRCWVVPTPVPRVW